MQSYHTARGYLQHRLSAPLPGEEAQFRMAPHLPGQASLRPKASQVQAANLRASAVLLCLMPKPATGEASVLFTLRSLQLGAHSGQISLPGGRHDATDPSLEATALREADEEVALPEQAVEVLGPLSPLVVPVSGNIIHPFVGVSTHPGPLRPNPDEVESYFFVPLHKLLDPALRLQQTRELRPEQPYVIPYFDVHPTVPLWGATAMIISEFVALWD